MRNQSMQLLEIIDLSNPLIQANPYTSCEISLNISLGKFGTVIYSSGLRPLLLVLLAIKKVEEY